MSSQGERGCFCTQGSSCEMSRMWTGPGPQWATGGDTAAVRLGSEASGRCRVTGGTVRVKFTCTGPDSVRFQKDFQNCMSMFWVMRSNSAPRSSGSMTYFPDVRRERAARPGGGGGGGGRGDGVE
ncbi:hypothetical protein EYF80_050993 [Liparis tanakae]|uniref:Uncharacterized protein n=1 Tax=Liparis tanakae TaxID=230148 RepID=A0A4Z2FD08_9TELE|nr:hypothetical protein EYF80_050993 [Liparis tanakae]